ncbi:MAG: DNA polymerase Y family protein [Myxococcales bacterium]|nr:DNA polymerase Y family protein [Myxococcales bacterium]MCB9580773.1 DNA polymerase Y family protein [Polyangiaceae bacterium]
MPSASAAERRIAAIELPELLCELAEAELGLLRRLSGKERERRPLGVVLSEDPLEATAVLEAVNAPAARFGVRAGQTIAEACVLVAHLVAHPLKPARVQATLGRIAEAALAYGASVGIEAPSTVWVDISGAAHLVGGEAALAEELARTVRELGHAGRVAIASGPRLAQAFARFGPSPVQVVPSKDGARAMGELPVAALPVSMEIASWFSRLGIISVADLAQLPRAASAARLGDRASEILDLAEGRDATPLVAYRLPTVPEEDSSWEEGVSGSEPLLFVLRGLAARLSARLAGRGEAAQRLELVVEHDRSIARLRGAAPETTLRFELASPLWREAELVRVVAARLERTELSAPSIGLRLSAPAVIRALGRQLDLSRVSGGLTGTPGVESLPVLLAELSSDIGKERVGVLTLADSHRPEARSQLSPAPGAPLPRRTNKKTKKKRAAQLPLSRVRPAGSEGEAPTRLLPEPLQLSVGLRRGATLRIEHRLFTIERVRFVERLEAVEWWTGAPVSRDYLRITLGGVEGVIDALVYVDRVNGKRYLHAIAD